MSAQKYCASCGNPIPAGQGSSCSMCYGDPAWGKDGYYQEYLDQMNQQEAARRQQPEDTE